MAEKVTLKDATTGVAVYPQTLVDSVQDESGNLLKTLVLMLNNTMAFTPTGDYNPATKLYVDNSISNSIDSSNLCLYAMDGKSNWTCWFWIGNDSWWS